ncbi:MAG: hypothetical protein CM15mP127_02950 [Gammaproteobacteria bacterium]|nr:MAG: hypothetical protein CM15mP127_02950 [Gammaproteobacteria bacterium]
MFSDRKPHLVEENFVGSSQHKELARQAVQESLVLLKTPIQFYLLIRLYTLELLVQHLKINANKWEDGLSHGKTMIIQMRIFIGYQVFLMS